MNKYICWFEKDRDSKLEVEAEDREMASMVFCRSKINVHSPGVTHYVMSRKRNETGRPGDVACVAVIERSHPRGLTAIEVQKKRYLVNAQLGRRRIHPFIVESVSIDQADTDARTVIRNIMVCFEMGDQNDGRGIDALWVSTMYDTLYVNLTELK